VFKCPRESQDTSAKVNGTASRGNRKYSTLADMTGAFWIKKEGEKKIRDLHFFKERNRKLHFFLKREGKQELEVIRTGHVCLRNF
jgi:hypothetical protein